MVEYSDNLPLELEEVKNGIILPVKAKPAARKNGVAGFFAGALKVAVTAAPEKGKANKAIIKVLARELGLSAKNISLASGELCGEKKFLVTSLSQDELISRITALGLK